MNKIIVLDWGIFSHRAIFALKNNPSIPATYTCMSMMLGNLKRIGVDKDDKIIIACDFMKSWRKQYEVEYKADRKKKREDSGIDFPFWWKKFDELLENIEISTNWEIIKIENLEADDIMAVISREYPNDEVVLVTYDSDLEQMWEYPNVKIFSPMSKKYKVKPAKFNVYNFLAKKVQKEASDNLVNPILSQDDYDKRMVVINLLELPEWVEHAVKQEIAKFGDRVFYPESFPFGSLKYRLDSLYTDKSKVVTLEQQIEKARRKEVRKANAEKNKKEKAERKLEREKKKAEREAKKKEKEKCQT